MPTATSDRVASLPVHSWTPREWASAVLTDPVALLSDHAFLEKKAALNAMELLTRWPNEWVPGWVETLTGVARDEAAHLSQAVRLLVRRGGKLPKGHTNPYAKALRSLVRTGKEHEALDRLLVSALIEVRSCERFSVLASVAEDEDLRAFYKALFSSEFGHYKVFLRLAQKIGNKRTLVEGRWQEMLAAEAAILDVQEPGPRMHSGVPTALPQAAVAS